MKSSAYLTKNPLGFGRFAVLVAELDSKRDQTLIYADLEQFNKRSRGRINLSCEVLASLHQVVSFPPGLEVSHEQGHV